MTRISTPFVARLELDVVSTVGDQHRPLVSDLAAQAEKLDIDDPDTKLVEDVQQVIHETHVDPCWPACPRHPGHPLWYRDGGWWCELDEVRMCDLGQLGSRTRSERGGSR